MNVVLGENGFGFVDNLAGQAISKLWLKPARRFVIAPEAAQKVPCFSKALHMPGQSRVHVHVLFQCRTDGRVYRAVNVFA